MKPFRFSLEKVLNVRQLQTTKAKQALASAQLVAGQAWMALEQARVARVTFETEWEARRTSRMTAGEWAAASQTQDGLVEAAKAAADRLHSALEVVAELREELVEAQRKEKALEKLRDQQREAHEHAMRATEQAETDEVAQAVGRAQKGVV